jgi:predicted dinucleotide-binding enzyme
MEQATRFADVVVLALPLRPARPAAVPGGCGRQDRRRHDERGHEGSGEPLDAGGRTSSELVAEWFPLAAGVKAFNTLDAEAARNGARAGHRIDRSPSSSRATTRANARVSTLIEEVGFTPVDVGSLAHAAGYSSRGQDLRAATVPRRVPAPPAADAMSDNGGRFEAGSASGQVPVWASMRPSLIAISISS